MAWEFFFHVIEQSKHVFFVIVVDEVCIIGHFGLYSGVLRASILLSRVSKGVCAIKFPVLGTPPISQAEFWLGSVRRGVK